MEGRGPNGPSGELLERGAELSVLDRLVDEAAATFDEPKRQQMYMDLEKRAFEQAWYGWLWQQNWNWAFNTRLNNFREGVTNQWYFTDTWLA